jgi:hypothetical protein
VLRAIVRAATWSTATVASGATYSSMSAYGVTPATGEEPIARL